MTKDCGGVDPQNPFNTRRVGPPADHKNMLNYGVHPDGLVNPEETPAAVSEYQLK